MYQIVLLLVATVQKTLGDAVIYHPAQRAAGIISPNQEYTWRLLLHYGCTPSDLHSSEMHAVHRLSEILHAQNARRHLEQMSLTTHVMDTLQLVNGYVESNVRTLLKYTLAHNSGLVNAQYFAADGNRIIEPSNDSTLKPLYKQRPDVPPYALAICEENGRALTNAEMEQRLFDNDTRNITVHLTVNRTTEATVIYGISGDSIVFDQCIADDLNLCNLNFTTCRTKNSSSMGLRLGNYECCCQILNTNNPSKGPHCFDGARLEEQHLRQAQKGMRMPQWEDKHNTLRLVLLIINSVFIAQAILIAIVIRKQRASGSHQQYASRGWALMELMLIGAALLYSITVVQYSTAPATTAACCIAIWARELGFAVFYGAIVLKIYRNLIEYRVRKAHHVYVKEKDMLKYLLGLVLVTTTGLLAWTLTITQDSDANLLLEYHGDGWSTPQQAACKWQHWSYAWQTYEKLFLLYGLWLCYKARSTTWVERWQFTLAVLLELIAYFIYFNVRYWFNIWPATSPQGDLIVTFVYTHCTVTVNVFLITLPKFYYITLDYPEQRTGGAGGKAGTAGASDKMKKNPWVRVRDEMENGVIDFAMVPIHEMNPEDIRAELKRIYTQLRMHKLKNLYQDNPHLPKKQRGKKCGSDREKQQIKPSRRTSNTAGNAGISPNARRSKPMGTGIEDDERSSMLYQSVELGASTSQGVNTLAQNNSSPGRPAVVISRESGSTDTREADATVESGPTAWTPRSSTRSTTQTASNGSGNRQRLNLDGSHSIRV